MQAFVKWRNVLIVRNASSLPSGSTQFASIHSTPTLWEKRKSKWNSDVGRGQQPTKSYIKYETRQKRADAKRALKDLLYKSGCSRFSLQFDGQTSKANGTSYWDAEQLNDPRRSDKKSQSKSAARAKREHYKRRKLRKESLHGDFEHHETVFDSRFGNRTFTWSFRSFRESPFESSSAGFEWREESNWNSRRHKEWETSTETESEDESCILGSYSDRTMLGLPPRGPLKIEDVKNAFRMSALKWHPDKHQGPSQGMAEEKFKLCVGAYKSLCSALSAA